VRAVVAFGASAALAVACSLGSLDGFSGGAAEDAGVDATNDGAGIVPPDGSSGSDGSSSGGDGSVGRFCSTRPTPPSACADFDDGTVPTAFTNASGNNLAIDGEGKDATKGLKASASANAGTSENACVYVNVDHTRTSITLEADVRLDVIGMLNFDVLNIRADASHEFSIHVANDQLFFEEDVPVVDGGPGELFTATPGKLTTTYRHLKFLVTVGDTAHGELFVDGTSVGTYDASNKTSQGKVQVQFGDCTFAGAKGWTLHYDNIVVYETL